jgi:hypothetical protein
MRATLPEDAQKPLRGQLLFADLQYENVTLMFTKLGSGSETPLPEFLGLE